MNTTSVVLNFAISLFSILNPLGAIPIFLTLTKSCSDQEIKKIASSCAFAVFTTIMLSALLGEHILNFFGISLNSFRIGGGILIAMMAMNMLKADEGKVNPKELQEHEDMSESIGIVPLAIPLLAGPGAISSCIIHAEKFKGPWHWIGALIVAISIGLIIKLIFSSGRRIGKNLGKIGLNVLTRIMGLVLMAIAIEFISNGVKQVLLNGR